MLRGLLENTCESWLNSEVDGIVKLCTAALVNPSGATSLMYPPTYWRVVEDVVEAAGELELVLSPIPTFFANRSVNVVDRIHPIGVAARGGKTALGNRHIAGSRIVNQEGHGVAGAILQSRRAAADPRVPAGVDRRAVAARIPVQVGVQAALHRVPGADLVGVNRSDSQLPTRFFIAQFLELLYQGVSYMT